MRKIITIAFLLLSTPAFAATYYVRPDGGCPQTDNGGTRAGCASICNGLTDAAYSAGVTPNCAFNHPYWSIPHRGDGTTAYYAAGGDTVVIKNNNDGTKALYRMGCQDSSNCSLRSVNVYNSSECHSSYTYDCRGDYLRDGTELSPTTIIGCSSSGCSDEEPLPQLWAAGRANNIFDVTNSDWITIKDIELTDHATGTLSKESACNSGLTSLSGLDGISGTGGSNIVLDNVWIHGFCRYGIYVHDVDNFSIIGGSIIEKNGMSGWSMGAGNGDMTGTILIDHSQITYNGCAEDYPSLDIMTGGCRAQADNIIADGIESAKTAGDWVITDSNISWNTHDGVDLLYVNDTGYSGGTVTYKRNRFEGNGGNPVKGPNALLLEDNLILGNCGYFDNQVFTSATWNKATDSCRANGNGIEIAFRDLTTVPKIINNTIVSNGDVAIDTTGTCTSGTDVYVKNNIIIGGKQHNDDTTFNSSGGNGSVGVFFNAGTLADPNSCQADFVETNNICYGFKEGSSACNGSGSTDTVYPSFVGGTIPMGPGLHGYYEGEALDDFVYLSAANDAADESATGADIYDFNGFDRSPSWDVGALDYGSYSSGETTPTCGDGNIDTGDPYYEVCDGSNLGGESCVSQGFDLGGTLSCSADCLTFNTSLCASSSCGNGTVEALEECDDGNNVNGDGCDAFCQIETPRQVGISVRGVVMRGVSLR